MSERTPFATLRGLRRARAAGERCELCSTALAPVHRHLLDLTSRKLVCACDPCAILFGDRQAARYRQIPRDVQLLPDFRMTDAQWEGLSLPINLAFFFENSVTGRIMALYPSPAGPTESLLTLDAWQELAADNPVLKELEPDVEALLVRRLGPAREYYRVPIDECYKLVGLIRTSWRGLSGGTEVWAEIERFFADLKRRSGGPDEVPHA